MPIDELLFMIAATIGAGAVLALSPLLRTICRASLLHPRRSCSICPRTFEITEHEPS